MVESVFILLFLPFDSAGDEIPTLGGGIGGGTYVVGGDGKQLKARLDEQTLDGGKRIGALGFNALCPGISAVFLLFEESYNEVAEVLFGS